MGPFQSRIFLTLVFALASTTVSVMSGARNAGSPEVFCSNLNTIISAGKDNFSSIRGARDADSGGQAWSSTASIPGATECLVWATEGGPTVSCDFPEAASVNNLEETYASLIKQTSDCLPSWSKHQSTQRRRLVKGMEFSHLDMTVRIEIVEKSSRKHPGFQLSLWVDKT